MAASNRDENASPAHDRTPEVAAVPWAVRRSGGSRLGGWQRWIVGSAVALLRYSARRACDTERTVNRGHTWSRRVLNTALFLGEDARRQLEGRRDHAVEPTGWSGGRAADRTTDGGTLLDASRVRR